MRRNMSLGGGSCSGSGGRRSFPILCVLLLFVFQGCAGSLPSTQSEDRAGQENAAAAPLAAEQSIAEATVGVAELDDEAASEENAQDASPVPSTRFDAGSDFVAETTASGGSGAAADTLLAVRHGLGDGYERVVLDLGVGDEAANVVPKWSLDTPEDDGLMRVYLPSASVTQVSGGTLGDGFLGDFYVVRAPDGGVFVDIFSREAFSYRTLDLRDPARLVIDFRGTGREPLIPLPRSGGNTVLTEPRAGARVNDPLTVSGYSRNFEAANTISVTGAEGEVIVRDNVQSNDWSSTWGYFEATVDLPDDFSGAATLRVGARSARDGSFEGVEVPISAP